MPEPETVVRYDRQDPGHGTIATLDIETTHFDAGKGEIVSVGVGTHRRGDPGSSGTYHTFHRDGSGEAAVVRRAFDRLATVGADGLVSYNGRAFDLAFVETRLELLGATAEWPQIATAPDRHCDLFADRKRRAEREGVKWPSLEECLDSYGYPRPRTDWRGEPITNTRFGDEVGPAYLEAVAADSAGLSELQEAIDHYLTTDLEANVAIYYADIGVEFEPHLLGTGKYL